MTISRDTCIIKFNQIWNLSVAGLNGIVKFLAFSMYFFNITFRTFNVSCKNGFLEAGVI